MLLLVVAVLLVAVLQAPILVLAQTPSPPFQFAHDESVAFAWADVKSGKAVIQVWNNTSTERSLEVKLEGMDFKDQDGAAIQKIGDVLVLWQEPIPLPAKGHADIPLKRQAAVDIKEGLYSGVLHVSVEELDTTIHIPLEITRPADEVSVAATLVGEAPVPLVSEWSLQHYRGVPAILGLKKLLLPANRFLPLDIEHQEGTAIALDGYRPLGYLIDPNQGLAEVTWTGKPEVRQPYDTYAVELAFDGLDYPGDYTGDIDLLPDDDEEGVVKLTVTVTDFIAWPMLIVLLGVCAAAVTKCLTGVHLNIRRLRTDATAIAKLAPQGTVQGPLGFTITDLGTLVTTGEPAAGQSPPRLTKAIQDLLTKYRFSTDTLSSDVPAYKEIADELTALEATVKDFTTGKEGTGKFQQELKDLEAALSGISASPAFQTSAEALLEGAPLKLQEFEERREQVRKATGIALAWPGWDTRQKAAHTALPQPVNFPTKKNDAIFLLNQVRTRLDKAKTPEEFERADVESVLRSAESLVAGLREERDEKDPKPMSMVPLPFPWKLPAEPIERLRILRRRLLRDNWLMFLGQLAVAVYTALVALYFGNAFGTPLHYIEAFAWGFGTVAVLEGLWAALNRLAGVAE
jgi:hypothetical protein